jgi:hypothetical protein
MAQGRSPIVSILECHIAENHSRCLHPYRLKGTVGAGVGHGAADSQDIPDPPCTGNGFIHGHNQAAQFHQFDDHLGHVVIQSHHIPLGQIAQLDPQGPLADQYHRGQVHQQVRGGSHHRRPVAHLQIPAGHGLVPVIEFFHFVPFPAEGPDHPHPGQVLPGGLEQPVQGPLHPGEQRHAADHDAHHHGQ